MLHQFDRNRRLFRALSLGLAMQSIAPALEKYSVLSVGDRETSTPGNDRLKNGARMVCEMIRGSWSVKQFLNDLNKSIFAALLASCSIRSRGPRLPQLL